MLSVQLVDHLNDGSLLIKPEGVAALQRFPNRIVSVAVLGPSGHGKSSLLNILIAGLTRQPYRDVFATGDSRTSGVSHGVSINSTPIPLQDGSSLLLLYVEGSENGSRANQTRLNTLAALLGSVVVINQRGPRFLTSALEFLGTIQATDSMARSQMLASACVYLLRDLSPSAMPTQQQLDGEFTAFRNRPDAQAFVADMQHFRVLHAAALPYPVNGVAHQEFLGAVSERVSPLLLTIASVKQLAGSPVSGTQLATIVTESIRSINQLQLPLHTLAYIIQEPLAVSITASSFDGYQRRLHPLLTQVHQPSWDPPFMRTHSAAQADALRLFEQQTAPLLPALREKYRQELVSKLRVYIDRSFGCRSEYDWVRAYLVKMFSHR